MPLLENSQYILKEKNQSFKRKKSKLKALFYDISERKHYLKNKAKESTYNIFTKIHGCEPRKSNSSTTQFYIFILKKKSTLKQFTLNIATHMKLI